MALKALLAHPWPGNARELLNRIERAVALALCPRVMPGDLFPEQVAGGLATAEAARDEAERRHILLALAKTKGAILPAAKMLRVSRTTLWEKMRRYDIAVDGR